MKNSVSQGIEMDRLGLLTSTGKHTGSFLTALS